jgi:SnoaL-like domain
MSTDHWYGYAACWDMAGDERRAALAGHVDPAVEYRDPQSEVHGIDELETYMRGFAAAFPGQHFEIRAVADHHGRSLARWAQVGDGGTVTMDGASMALHASDGRLLEVTGFFFP